MNGIVTGAADAMRAGMMTSGRLDETESNSRTDHADASETRTESARGDEAPPRRRRRGSLHLT